MSEVTEKVRTKRNRRQRSCKSCNERKVKCDLMMPCCSGCKRKGFTCAYITRSVAELSKSAVRQVVDRISVEMNIYKQLEAYWKRLAKYVLSPSFDANSPSRITPDQLFSPQNSEQSVRIQSMSALIMFSKYIEMAMPQYQSNFKPYKAAQYWKLLTGPIHVDLVKDFEDPEFKNEKRSLGIHIKKPYKRYPPCDDQDSIQFAFGDSSSPITSPSSCSSSVETVTKPKSTIASPHIHTNDDGTLTASTGRIFDSLDAFLHIDQPDVEKLLSVLEYGVAFLRGLSIMNMPEMVKHIAFNVERILNLLVFDRRRDLTSQLAHRMINCLTIFAFHYEHVGRFAALASILLLAHQMAIDYNLHETHPVLAGRVYLLLLWQANSQGEREEYWKLASKYLPSPIGIDWRCKFSYIAAAIRTQGPAAPDVPVQHGKIIATTSIEYWNLVNSYIEECDVMIAMLHRFGLSRSAQCHFKTLIALFRAEVAIRLNNVQVAIESSMSIERLVSEMSDMETWIAITAILESFPSRKDVLININGQTKTLKEYLHEVLLNISLPPTQGLLALLTRQAQEVSSTSDTNQATFPSPHGLYDIGNMPYKEIPMQKLRIMVQQDDVTSHAPNGSSAT